jgi:hypothetical protein
MLYLFAGEDAKNRIKSYEAFTAKNSKGAESFFVSHNDFSAPELENFYSGSGLFSAKNFVVYSGALEREETRSVVLQKLKEMSDSASTFVFLEGKSGKPILDAFKKAKAEVNVFDLPKEKKELFNNFALANDFGAKDKLNLWIHYRQAIDRGVSLEELSGILFWKVKDMLLKSNFGKYKKEELENFAKEISYLIPNARREGKDAETVFEQFLLEALE